MPIFLNNYLQWHEYLGYITIYPFENVWKMIWKIFLKISDFNRFHSFHVECIFFHSRNFKWKMSWSEKQVIAWFCAIRFRCTWHNTVISIVHKSLCHLTDLLIWLYIKGYLLLNEINEWNNFSIRDHLKQPNYMYYTSKPNCWYLYQSCDMSFWYFDRCHHVLSSS